MKKAQGMVVVNEFLELHMARGMLQNSNESTYDYGNR
jgi:hypothetical protein